MLTIGAFVLLLGCVFGSYIVSGGSFDVLVEALPFEMWTIGGAAVASFIMANSMHDLKHCARRLQEDLRRRRVQEGRLRRSAEPAVFPGPAGHHQGQHGARAAYREAR